MNREVQDLSSHRLPILRLFVRANDYFHDETSIEQSDERTFPGRKSMIPRTRLITVFLLSAVFLVACRGEKHERVSAGVLYELPPIRTKADSIALSVFEAFGGPEAWAKIRYLRFDFGIEDGETKTVYRKHLWDRYEGTYREEWTAGNDSTYVVLLNVQSQEGTAYLNGEAVGGEESEELVRKGYRGFINDTYWLLAPVKLLDPGVTRLYLPGWSDQENDVITTTYDNVGLTPDDQFWFWVDKDSGKLVRWAYVLEGNEKSAPTIYEWGDYESFVTDAGTIKFIPRKIGPAGRDLLTDNIAIPLSVEDDAFTNPMPQL